MLKRVYFKKLSFYKMHCIYLWYFCLKIGNYLIDGLLEPCDLRNSPFFGQLNLSHGMAAKLGYLANSLSRSIRPMLSF